jgi:hypothetical protein
MRVVRESELGNGKGDYGLGGRTITNGIFALIGRLKKRKRRPRQPRLLAGRRSPDPRLQQSTVDPNARFLGEQMGGGAGRDGLG